MLSDFETSNVSSSFLYLGHSALETNEFGNEKFKTSGKSDRYIGEKNAEKTTE